MKAQALIFWPCQWCIWYFDDGDDSDNIDYSDIHIVICTAHDEFALKAIQYEVVDYLMKPIEIQDLQTPLIKSEKKTGKMKSYSMTLVPFKNFPMLI